MSSIRARFPKGVPMTVEEVSKVVGPEFAEAHKNPHPAVLKLREEMMSKKTARTRLTWKNAADLTGLYGFSKGIQRSAEAATRKLSRHSLKVAKRIFAKDAEVVPFLQAHMKREDSKPAKVLLAALKEVGPKLASEMQGGTGTSKTATEYGLYGFKAKTAELGLDACKEVRSTAGRITAEIHQRHAADHGKFTGFYKEHSKQAKCAYAGMLLSCYPDASMKTAGGGAGIQVLLSGKTHNWRLPQPVRFKDRGTMSVEMDRGHVQGQSDVSHLGIASHEQFAFIEEPGHIEDIELSPMEWRKFRDQALAFAVGNGFTGEDITFTFFLGEVEDAMLSAGFTRSSAPSDFDVEGTATISASWGNVSQLDGEMGFTATFSITPMFQEAWDSLSTSDWDDDGQGPRRFGSYRQLTGGQLEWED